MLTVEASLPLPSFTMLIISMTRVLLPFCAKCESGESCLMESRLSKLTLGFLWFESTSVRGTLVLHNISAEFYIPVHRGLYPNSVTPTWVFSFLVRPFKSSNVLFVELTGLPFDSQTILAVVAFATSLGISLIVIYTWTYWCFSSQSSLCSCASFSVFPLW